MGYSERKHPGGSIKSFEPDETDDAFYIALSENLHVIMERICTKWPGISLEDIRIEAEYINTDCIGYDLHDPSDWTNYLKIERTS